MDVLSSSYLQLDQLENEILGELAKLEASAASHLTISTGYGRITSNEPENHTVKPSASTSGLTLNKTTGSLGSSDPSHYDEAPGLKNGPSQRLGSHARSGHTTIRLDDNFSKIESFGNKLKTIANESDCVLNKLKTAVNIVECVSVLYHSASKMVEFFSQAHDSSGANAQIDNALGFDETVFGEKSAVTADLHASNTHFGAGSSLLAPTDNQALGPGFGGMFEDPMGRRLSQATDPLSGLGGLPNQLSALSLNELQNTLAAAQNGLDNELASLPSGALSSQVSELANRYASQVHAAKKGGYWEDVLVVISRGYIGQVIGSLRWLVLRYLSGSLLHLSTGAPASQASDAEPDTTKLLTRLAVCLGSEAEVFGCYLSSIRLEFGSGSRKPSSASQLSSHSAIASAAGQQSEIGSLKRSIQRARNALFHQANVVLSELGGAFYIKICREIHDYTSSEAAAIFIEFIKASFGSFLPDDIADAALDVSHASSEPSVKAGSNIANSSSYNHSVQNSAPQCSNNQGKTGPDPLNVSHTSHISLDAGSAFAGASNALNSLNATGTSFDPLNSTANSLIASDVGQNAPNSLNSSYNLLYSSSGYSNEPLSSTQTTNACYEAILAELEKALESPAALEAISSDPKYQKILDTIAIMASLWSDFESALRESTRPVYSKLSGSLVGFNATQTTSLNTTLSSNIASGLTNLALNSHANNTDGLEITAHPAAGARSSINPLSESNLNDTSYSADGLVALSLATKTLQSILCVYVQLQQLFIVKAVQQAIQVGDTIYLAQDSLVSTLVDDVFFILQKSQQRSIGTGDLQTACATFNQTSAIISNELKQALVENLLQSQPIYERWTQKLDNIAQGSVQDMLEDHFKKTRAAMPDSIGSKFSFVHSLNNIEECLGLLEKFKQEMAECFTSQFLTQNQEKSLLVDNTIQALDLVQSELEEILDSCCTHAINMLKDHLNEPLVKFASIEFEMDEEQYSRLQNEEALSDNLVSVLNTVLGHITANYTPKAGLTCMTKLVEKLSKYLETCTLSKRFTVYGAVYFDNAVRSLMYACSNYSQEIRKHFTTLLQISDVLNVNNRDDLMLLKESEYTIDISKYSALRTDLTF